MQSVRYAVLGLILQKPTYPYELALTFEQRIGPAWHINRGQIYQMVYQLEREGLVERTNNKPNSRGPRWTFRATPPGEEEFDHWIMERSERATPRRDNLHIKLALSRPKHVDHLLQAIDRKEQACQDKMSEYSELQKDLARFGGTGRWEEVSLDLLLDRSVEDLHSEINWLRKVRASVREFFLDEERGAGKQGRDRPVAFSSKGS